MPITLIPSDKNTCNVGLISDLVNRLQLFFVSETSNHNAVLPSKPLNDPSLSHADIERSMESQGLLKASFPEERFLLITSRKVKQDCFDRDTKLSIVSDAGRVWDSADQRSLWFAVCILRDGLSSVTSCACNHPHCICSGSDFFFSLCSSCEKHFRDLDYRDAIGHLRIAIQWINERLLIKSPNLSIPPVSQVPAQLPLANYYAKAHRVSKPFRGKAVLMVLHFLSDLVPFVTAMRKMGAEYSDMTLIAKPYPYPKRDYISHHLQALGVRVYRASKKVPVEYKAKQILSELRDTFPTNGKKMLVIEDGGYFTPLLHLPEYKRLLRSCIGTVEQTTKGIREDEKIFRKRIPILSVAKCSFKSRYEAPEIGRVTIQNISRFVPNVKLSGGNAIVIGFGDIGAQVAYHLNKMFNMTISVIDDASAKILEARHKRDFVAEAETCFSKLRFKSNVALIVGTTGKQSIKWSLIKQLPSGCILVSTSSDRIEIDVDSIEAAPKTRKVDIEEGNTDYFIGKHKVIKLLAEGYPINFYGSESLPNASIDPIMTLLLLCGIELCLAKIKDPGINQEYVDNVVTNYSLIDKFLSL